MSDPLPQILDTLAGVNEIRKAEVSGRSPTTRSRNCSGGFGHLPVDRLPTGWANVTIHRKNRAVTGGDDFTEYYGPILKRLATIEVGGERITGTLDTEGTA